MKTPDFVYIDTQPAFVKACASLEGCEYLAVDTEFVGEKTFYPRVELIQLAGDGAIHLVDATRITDYGPLGLLMGKKAQTKVFHAADSDLRILARCTGVRPEPVFDTQVAASLLGYGAQISLVNLVKELLGVRLSAKQTTSDWSQRPLSAEQLAYAADDVAHLVEVCRRLDAELQAKGRRAWYEDEQRERMEHSFSDDEPFDPAEMHRRVKGWMALSPRELAVLRELAVWREETARGQNLPRRMVLTDEGAIELARFQPANREAAKKLRAVNTGQILRSFSEITAVMARGQKLPKEQWPERPVGERPDIPTGLQELCLSVLRLEAERLQVAPNVFATTSDIQAIINNRHNLPEHDIPLLHGWRREAVGEKILQLIRGEIAVAVNPDGTLRTLEV